MNTNDQYQNVSQAAEDIKLVEFNRQQLTPFISQVVDRIYQEIDKATEKGVALANLTQEDANRCVAQILLNIHKNMGSELYTERNIFQEVAYYTGMVMGYPTSAVSSIMKKMPLATHFAAGFNSGEVLFQRHAFSAYMKLAAKKTDFTNYLKERKEMKQGKELEVSQTKKVIEPMDFTQNLATA